MQADPAQPIRKARADFQGCGKGNDGIEGDEYRLPQQTRHVHRRLIKVRNFPRRALVFFYPEDILGQFFPTEKIFERFGNVLQPVQRKRTFPHRFFIRRTFIRFGIGNQHRKLDIEDIQLRVKILARGKQRRRLRCRYLCKTETAHIPAKRERPRLQYGVSRLRFCKSGDNSRHQLGFSRNRSDFFDTAGGFSFFGTGKRCNTAG